MAKIHNHPAILATVAELLVTNARINATLTKVRLQRKIAKYRTEVLEISAITRNPIAAMKAELIMMMKVETVHVWRGSKSLGLDTGECSHFIDDCRSKHRKRGKSNITPEINQRSHIIYYQHHCF